MGRERVLAQQLTTEQRMARFSWLWESMDVVARDGDNPERLIAILLTVLAAVDIPKEVLAKALVTAAEGVDRVLAEYPSEGPSFH